MTSFQIDWPMDFRSPCDNCLHHGPLTITMKVITMNHHQCPRLLIIIRLLYHSAITAVLRRMRMKQLIKALEISYIINCFSYGIVSNDDNGTLERRCAAIIIRLRLQLYILARRCSLMLGMHCPSIHNKLVFRTPVSLLAYSAACVCVISICV